jgi:hypothetical protein
MPCEKYQDALIDLVAKDAEPRRDALAHLDACISCRSYFEQEQSLFASIDSGVHLRVNASLPVALVQRLQARVAQEPAPPRQLLPAWVLASAAMTVIIILSVSFVRHSNGRLANGQVIARSHRASTVSGSSNKFSSSADPATHSVTNPVSMASLSGPRRTTNRRLERQKDAEKSTGAEILVPGDQEMLLAEYGRVLRRRRFTFATLSMPKHTFEPLLISVVEISELEVEPLSEPLLGSPAPPSALGDSK